MGNKMHISDLITVDFNENSARRYIDYYFHHMVGLNQKKQIYFDKLENAYISIMKDEIDRKLSGTGRLREKPWSNFLFYFVDLNDYKQVFGTYAQHRNLVSITSDGYLNLTRYDYSSSSRKSNALYSNSKNNYQLARFIFDRIKNEKSFLFVRSYVYITIVLYNENEVSTSDFLTFYFNTNYNFTETNRKINFIANVTNSYLVKDIPHELSILEDNNKDLFDCVKAYTNTIEYTNLTGTNLNKIVEAINDNNEYVLIEGSARTGKTIIAMSLLRVFPSSNLLLMNFYFYQALKDAFAALDVEFPLDRIFHQVRGKSGYYDDARSMNFDFSIIDECQRLGEKFKLVDRIISSKTHSCTIFLGDSLQRLKPSSDDGISYIIERLIEHDKELVMFKFTSSVGIPPEILKNIKYLLKEPTVVSPHFLGEYSIELFADKAEFLNAYENDSHKNRHLATIQYPTNNFSLIGKYSAFPKKLINTDYPYFLNKEIINKYYLSPFELISREVESIYVYIRNNIDVDSITGFVFYQLYVLMTRATISLNIYCENDSLYEFLKSRLDDIKHYSLTLDYSIENCIKEGQFEVNELILDQFNQKYLIESPKEKIEERCITRLVHFTEESNISSIIKHGLLPRSVLVSKSLEFDYNDENRWDKHEDSISLSIENPNQWLLENYKKKYPQKKFKLITINPAILYSSFVNNEYIKLVPRLYCNYNAASSSTEYSDSDIDIMFSDKVQTYHWKYNSVMQHTRQGKNDNQPTCNQAEILFFGRIPPEFIESIEDI